MSETNCPLGHTCDKCNWYIHLRGKDPTSMHEIDKHGCAIAWIPILLIENSQQQRQTAAAVESFRNSMTKNTQALAQAVAYQRQLEAPE